MSFVSKFFNFIRSYFIPTDVFTDNIQTVSKAPIEQQDVQTLETIKRVRMSFEQQQDAIKARSLKQHNITCNIVECVSERCFIREGDKIVSDPHVVEIKRKADTSMGNFKSPKPRKLYFEKKNRMERIS